jgi:hypothetical protein
MRLFIALLVLCTAASLVKEADSWWWGGYGLGLGYGLGYGFGYNPFFNFYGGYYPYSYGYGYPYFYGKRDVSSFDNIFENMTHCMFLRSESKLVCHKLSEVVECESTFTNSSSAVGYDAFGISWFNYTLPLTTDLKIELYPRYWFSEKVDKQFVDKLSQDFYYLYYAGNETVFDHYGFGIKDYMCFEKVYSFLKDLPVFKVKLTDAREVSVIAEILEQK